MTEELKNPDISNTPVANPEAEALQTKLDTAQQQLNKYDGERKDFSEQSNLIANLTSQVEGLTTKLQDAEDEDTRHVSVTQEELRSYKAGEGDRFNQYNKDQEAKVAADQVEYQKHLATASLHTKDEALFDEVCKEHDALVASGAMPASTGSMQADAQLAWTYAENALLRKRSAAGQVTSFGSIEEARAGNAPVVPGQQELSSNSTPVQKTAMPGGLPDDAKEFIALMGMGADSVNRGLAR